MSVSQSTNPAERAINMQANNNWVNAFSIKAPDSAHWTLLSPLPLVNLEVPSFFFFTADQFGKKFHLTKALNKKLSLLVHVRVEKLELIRGVRFESSNYGNVLCSWYHTHRYGIPIGRIRSREKRWQLIDSNKIAECLLAAQMEELAIILGKPTLHQFENISQQKRQFMDDNSVKEFGIVLRERGDNKLEQVKVKIGQADSGTIDHHGNA